MPPIDPKSSKLSAFSPRVKSGFHEKNEFRLGYDLPSLERANKDLKPFLSREEGEIRVDYTHSQAVIELNRAILKHHFQMQEWFLPEGALCPAIPGRWDYLLRLRDLLPQEAPLRGLDIGTGSSLIYSLLAVYGLNIRMVGSDISQESLQHARKILHANPLLPQQVELRHQAVAHHIFQGIVKSDETFDFCLCNPPFHGSEKEAEQAAQRKAKNLDLPQQLATSSNFGGRHHELWCKGGEAAFLKKMMKESLLFASQIRWFSSLVSKSENVAPMIKFLKKHHATAIEIFPLEHGNKKSRAVAWSFSEVRSIN